ncbi:MAG: hypothetical protein NXI32_21920 [bacterium]|nr:hypothetical protein [bacterium]
MTGQLKHGIDAASIVFLTLLVIGTACRHASGDETWTPSDCGSMLQHVRNNYASVNSFDVLLKYERQEDGDDISITFKRACRIAFNPEDERLAAISIKEEVDHLRQRRRVHSLSFLVDKNTVLQTDFVSQPKSKSKRSFASHLQEAGIANIFMTGASFFPNATYDREQMDAEWDATIGAITAYGSVKPSGHLVEVDVEFPFRQGKFGEYSTRWEYVFDLHKSLPTRYSCVYLNRSDRGIQETLRYRSLLDWGEPTAGVHLPTNIFISETGSGRNGDNQLVVAQKTTSVDIQWLSVNHSKSIDPSMWNEDELMDYEAAQGLCQFPISSP